VSSIGVILLGVGGWVIFGAIDNIVNGAELELLGLGIGVMALSSLVNLFVSGWLLRMPARRTLGLWRPRGTTCARTSGVLRAWPWGSPPL
jgi:hypothetical protein